MSSKNPLPTAGILSNLYVSMTKNPNIKNEKKYVKLEQSEHFPINTKPSLKYHVAYSSEVFEDTVDVFPSLLARVATSIGFDSRLRLSVIYSSSLTSGKEVVLATQSFLESELIRSVRQSSVFIISLDSDYCIAAKAYVDIVQPLPPLLSNESFPVAASHTEKNPLTQNYVFYNELDSITPYLDAKEQCWEPKFVAPIPYVFLSNFQSSLERSISAWEGRYELERMRQGRFISDTEALNSGWHILDVQVITARIGSTKATIDRINLMRSQNNQVPTGPVNPPAAEGKGNNSVFLSYYPLTEDYPDNTPAAAPSQLPRSDSQRQGRRTGHSSGFKFLGSSSAKKVDENLPSTYVELYIEDM